MITSSGAKCDVCGKYILPLDPEERVHHFGVKGIDKTLCCDNACKKILKQIGSDWKKLPNGPLKKAFQEAEEEIVAKDKEKPSGEPSTPQKAKGA